MSEKSPPSIRQNPKLPTAVENISAMLGSLAATVQIEVATAPAINPEATAILLSFRVVGPFLLASTARLIAPPTLGNISFVLIPYIIRYKALICQEIFLSSWEVKYYA